MSIIITRSMALYVVIVASRSQVDVFQLERERSFTVAVLTVRIALVN